MSPGGKGGRTGRDDRVWNRGLGLGRGELSVLQRLWVCSRRLALAILPLGYETVPRPGAAHSHFLVEAQALVDGSSVRNALHDFLRELFEEVGR